MSYIETPTMDSQVHVEDNILFVYGENAGTFLFVCLTFTNDILILVST